MHLYILPVLRSTQGHAKLCALRRSWKQKSTQSLFSLQSRRRSCANERVSRAGDEAPPGRRPFSPQVDHHAWWTRPTREIRQAKKQKGISLLPLEPPARPPPSRIMIDVRFLPIEITLPPTGVVGRLCVSVVCVTVSRPVVRCWRWASLVVVLAAAAMRACMQARRARGGCDENSRAPQNQAPRCPKQQLNTGGDRSTCRDRLKSCCCSPPSLVGRGGVDVVQCIE